MLHPYVRSVRSGKTPILRATFATPSTIKGIIQLLGFSGKRVRGRQRTTLLHATTLYLATVRFSFSSVTSGVGRRRHFDTGGGWQLSSLCLLPASFFL